MGIGGAPAGPRRFFKWLHVTFGGSKLRRSGAIILGFSGNGTGEDGARDGVRDAGFDALETTTDPPCRKTHNMFHNISTICKLITCKTP